MAKGKISVGGGKLSTGKVSLPKVSVPQVNGRTRPVRIYQNPMSPIPGNVSATSKPGGAEGSIPVPSFVSRAMAPAPVGKAAKAQKFENGGLVKPGGSGNLPPVMKSKVISTK